MHFVKLAGLASLLAASSLARGTETSELKAITRHYSELVAHSYQRSLATANALETAVQQFTAKPSAETLEQAKKAWVKARMAYGLTEAFRFYEGPIDHPADGPEGLLNAWPLDEAYIDYTDMAPNSGIINNPSDYPTITKDLLVNLNERNGEKNIATGYHAIEFLLWGQDRSNNAPNADSAGVRSWQDYLTASNATAPNGRRRGVYLVTVTDLLTDHLAQLVAAWDLSDPASYANTFINADPKTSLKKILNGIGTLSFGELAGERMFVAVDEMDQEHEQSCFSDMTHLDVLANNQGIVNVLFGDYQVIAFTAPHEQSWQIDANSGAFAKGPSIYSYLVEYRPALASRLRNVTQTTVKSLQQVPVPFDNAITNQPDAILQGVMAARSQGTFIQELGRSAFGLDIELGVGD
jgi:putative iron-regulated protein